MFLWRKARGQAEIFTASITEAIKVECPTSRNASRDFTLEEYSSHLPPHLFPQLSSQITLETLCGVIWLEGSYKR